MDHSVARYVRSLAPLTPLTRSAPLRSLAPFIGSLTHFAHSLVGQLKFLNMCSHCYRVSREQTRFWRSLETRPYLLLQIESKSLSDSCILLTDSSSYRHWSYSLIFTQKMIAVTSSKQWIHFFLSDLWPPTSYSLKLKFLKENLTWYME